MNARTIQADKTANEGHALGVSLWTALQTVHMNNRRDAFESALQTIVQHMPGCEEPDLIEASAMLALLDMFPPSRARSIKSAAAVTYSAYCSMLDDGDLADYAYDQARDDKTGAA